MPKIAVYPGSFDPITNGHLDIVKRALKICDSLVIAVVENPPKTTLFSVRDRISMLKDAVSGLERVEIDSFHSLLVDYVQKKRAHIIIRGLRAVSDFEYELQMALMNRKLNSSVDTVFLMTDEPYSSLSSSLVKEIVRLGGNATDLISPFVAKKLQKKLLR